LALLVAGAVTEIVIFTSVDSSGVCSRSYNLVSLVGALLNEISMSGSSVPAQTWSLFVNYVILILAFPVVTHLLQIAFIVGRFRSRKMNVLSEGTLVIWYFTSIEPLLIGVFAVEYKVRSSAPATFMPRELCIPFLLTFCRPFSNPGAQFPNLIMKLAGETNASFLDIDSDLGKGFYILIAYSVVAGFLQFSLRIRHCDGSKQSSLIEEDAGEAEKEKECA
jgi:hypothetical protein